ncbi:MAG TPA: 50S ribosomal protein L13 [Candidatus Deferrimicrobium sp.]|nr:50S ribosomal protein L13 [Candidatus Deferrimicrobium sp.]
MVQRIINADGIVLGRLASKVAKMLLQNEKVIIINAEKAIISGRKRSIIHQWKERTEIHTLFNPMRGPFWPKSPTQIVRRTVRGMLPWKKPRGKQVYKNLRVVLGTPEDLNKILGISGDLQIETFPDFSETQLRGTYMELYDLAKEIGWK